MEKGKGKRKTEDEGNEKERENSCLKHEIVTDISDLIVRFGSQSLSETTKIHDCTLCSSPSSSPSSATLPYHLTFWFFKINLLIVKHLSTIC